jgi:hypothetical protein
MTAAASSALVAQIMVAAGHCRGGRAEAGPARARRPDAIVVVRRRGRLRDLNWVPRQRPRCRTVRQHRGRRSVTSLCATCAQAVQDLFRRQAGNGRPSPKATTNFDVASVHARGLPSREGMQKIVKDGQLFSRALRFQRAAREELSGEPYSGTGRRQSPAPRPEVLAVGGAS